MPAHRQSIELTNLALFNHIDRDIPKRIADRNLQRHNDIRYWSFSYFTHVALARCRRGDRRPIFVTQWFGYFASDPAPVYFPGAPFFAAGVLVLLAILIFQRVVTIVSSTA